MGIRERKEREKEARREEIVDAAEKVFFEKGISAATMDDIAESAELSKGTLYLYFKRREDLLLAIICRGLDVLAGLFEKAVSTGEPTLKLIINLGDAYYEYFHSYRNYFRMGYFFENPDHHELASTEMLEECSSHDERVWGHVIQTLQKGVDEGLLRSDLNPKEAAVILWSNSYGLMRLLDRQDAHWKEHMGLDLEVILRRSTRMLLEAMMTSDARSHYAEFFRERDINQVQA